MTVDEAMGQPGDLVGAWETGAVGHAWLGLYAVGEAGAKLLAFEHTDAEGHQRRERQLRERRIRIGVTDGGEYVWTQDDGRELTAWNLEQRLFTVTKSEVRVGGEVIPRARIHRVVSFMDPSDLGHRGVGVECHDAPPVVLVQEHDPAPSVDPTYGRDNLAIDAAWATILGRDVAAWLGVPHEDRIQ